MNKLRSENENFYKHSHNAKKACKKSLETLSKAIENNEKIFKELRMTLELVKSQKPYEKDPFTISIKYFYSCHELKGVTQ